MNYNQLARGNNLKRIRKNKGVTQRTLAMVCSQAESQISCYERGKTMPRYDVLRAIARFLEVNVEDIYPSFKEIDEQVDRIKEIFINKIKSVTEK